MPKSVHAVAALIALSLLSGCSTTGSIPRGACIALTATAAGVGAGFAVDDDEDNEVGIGALAAVAGGIVGAALCPSEPEPVAVAEPEPAPAPAPAPEPEPCVDADADGVCDDVDDCPGTPAGTIVDSRGCPDIPDLSGVNFEFNKATLTGSGRQILDEAVAVLKTHDYLYVDIVGHTDAVGSDAYNQRLSERRAQAVLGYLSGAGIAANRLRASGRGESEPVATNDTDEGRAANRRVELTARPR